MGELPEFYAAGDVAFVGGSLVAVGGHNLLEPAALGVPVLTGPHTFNAPDIAQLLMDEGAAQSASDAGGLGDAVERLIGNPTDRERRGRAGRKVVDDNRG